MTKSMAVCAYVRVHRVFCISSEHQIFMLLVRFMDLYAPRRILASPKHPSHLTVHFIFSLLISFMFSKWHSTVTTE